MSAAVRADTPTQASPLGRLTELGITEPWQLALLLPESYVDLRTVNEDATGFDEGIAVTLYGQVRGNPCTGFGGRAPRTTVSIQLSDRTVIRLTWFGDARETTGRLKPGHMVLVSGILSQFNGQWEMVGGTVVDVRWKGRCKPNYAVPGKRMGAATVHERVMGHLRQAIEPAASYCETLLQGVASPSETLKIVRAPEGVENFARLLVWAHCPPAPGIGRKCIEALDRLSALYMLRVLFESHERTSHERPALPLDIAPRLAQWPFPPSASQRAALQKLEALFRAGRTRSAILSGDTGTGKTITYATLAAAVVDQGGRVAVMLPGEALATQIADAIRKVFPDLSLALISGDSKASGADASIVVGTTAIIHRNAGTFDLVICDEQQKLGADQRRKLKGQHAHQLDVTATAIPRTQALAKYGLVDTVHLREGHSDKTIVTTLWERDDMRKLFAEVRRTLAGGGRVLVVYPAIKEGKAALRNIEAAKDKWEAAFPGQVRVITGKAKGVEKVQALADLSAGVARIGVCTSVVEVGIDIPDMRRVVVVHPERFGLTTLHQFRGRLAREGGRGDFDMLLVDDISGDTRERLRVMVDVSDGYELAEADLRLRGPGELSARGSRQSGGAMTMLFGREIDPAIVEQVEPVMKRWLARRTQTSLRSVDP